MPPGIEITADDGGITIADTGPGIPESTIDAILDFAIRVSNREAYVSSNRVARGNALNTVLAVPFVMDGDHGRVDIVSRGRRHEMRLALNRIRQEGNAAIGFESASTGRIRQCVQNPRFLGWVCGPRYDLRGCRNGTGNESRIRCE